MQGGTGDTGATGVSGPAGQQGAQGDSGTPEHQVRRALQVNVGQPGYKV